MAVKFLFEINERTHYPAFAECVFFAVLRSEFCHAGKNRIRLSNIIAHQAAPRFPGHLVGGRIGCGSAVACENFRLVNAN